jgi:hypothetical protein
MVYQWDYYEELHFTQDEAPPHFALPVRGWLDNNFPSWWVGRGGKNSRRPALILCDLLLWVWGQTSSLPIKTKKAS